MVSAIGEQLLRSMTIRFNEVSTKATKSGKCAGGCGRRTKRTEKFWQTVNPFNKNALGAMKSEAEIRVELFQKKADWLTKPVLCTECEYEVQQGSKKLNA